MAKHSQSLPRPTEAELEILRVLWERGPQTVREVHETLSASASKDTGYTTTLKLLQKMTEKNLVRRDESRRSHVYEPMVRAEHTQKQLVRDLLHRAYGGSPGRLVMQALSEERASPDELAEIRRLIDDLESKNGGTEKK